MTSKEGNIIPLFGIPFYYSELNYHSKVIKVHAKKCEYIQAYDGLWISKETGLIDKITDLKTSITSHLDNYLYNILQVDESFKYYFSDSWFVKISPGGRSSDHDHLNSLFSGVYYFDDEYNNSTSFKVEHQSSGISFVNYSIKYKENNQYNSQNFNFTPKNNSIIIFPSNLKHFVNTNTSDQDRYSFAFNIMPHNFSSDFIGIRI